jgi:hypothetical protein
MFILWGGQSCPPTSFPAGRGASNDRIGIGAPDVLHAFILTFGKINLMKPDTQKNLDVLQNIEFRIIDIYRADPSLLDLDVKDALDALVRHYRAEEERRRPPALQLHDARSRFSPTFR